jgi:hypothetical protein
LIKDGEQNEIDLLEFKKHIMSNINKATNEFENDIGKYKMKNKLKGELERKIKSIDDRLNKTR